MLKIPFKNVRNGWNQVTFLDCIKFSSLIQEPSKLEAEQILKYLTHYYIINNINQRLVPFTYSSMKFPVIKKKDSKLVLHYKYQCSFFFFFFEPQS